MSKSFTDQGEVPKKILRHHLRMQPFNFLQKNLQFISSISDCENLNKTAFKIQKLSTYNIIKNYRQQKGAAKLYLPLSYLCR